MTLIFHSLTLKETSIINDQLSKDQYEKVNANHLVSLLNDYILMINLKNYLGLNFHSLKRFEAANFVILIHNNIAILKFETYFQNTYPQMIDNN